jgi:hypothetical protein
MHRECQDHEWVVFTTFLDESSIGVQCSKCGLVGRIVDPIMSEWEQAFFAVSSQYAWHAPERVTDLRDVGRWYVERVG